MENKTKIKWFVEALITLVWSIIIFIPLMILSYGYLIFLSEKQSTYGGGLEVLAIFPLAPFLFLISVYLASVIHKKFKRDK